ncbi:septum formation family protein [Nocardiopsis nanhaiensis]
MLSEARHPLLGRIAMGTLAAGAALSLSACGLPLLPPALSGDTDDPSPVAEPEPEPEPTETEEPVETEEPEPVETEPDDLSGPEDTNVNLLTVGDCLHELEFDEDDTVATVPVVDCSEPHELEVYADGDLDADGDYPGFDEVADMVDEECVDMYEGFVGVPLEESVLAITTLFPSDETWDAGDRDFLCIVGDPTGPTTGSFEDSNI